MQQKGHFGFREQLAAIIIVVVCLLTLFFRSSLGTALFNTLVLTTVISYIYFLWEVQQALQKREQQPGKNSLLNAYVAVVGITLLDLFFFSVSYRGFLLATAVLLLICFVLLIFLRSYR